MDKTTEIKLLDNMIKVFGAESYIGPWLKDHRESIVRSIKNDLPIDVRNL